MRISFVTVLLLAAINAHADAPPPGAFVPEETPVKVRLLQPLKSNHERSGDRIHFETTEDVVGSDRAVLIPKGTPVAGTVTRASHRGMLGKPGRLEFSIDAVQVSDTVRVPLRKTLNTLHGRDNSAGSITTALLLLGPAWLLINGREVSVPAGREFTVFVDQKTALPTAGATVAAVPNLLPPAASPAPAVLLAAARPDLAHLQDFHLKSGGTITGSLRTQKDGMYFVLTETGELVIDREMLESISPKKN